VFYGLPAHAVVSVTLSMRSWIQSSASVIAEQDGFELSVILPCLDEAETVGGCVRDALDALERLGIRGEVIVVDNGSRDGSSQIAERAGARVVREPRRGYGFAMRRGIDEARAPYCVAADADGSYDVADLGRFRDALLAGNELVMGSRLRSIEPGAMPWLHRWVGNPILSALLRLFFGRGVSDAHCGMRAFTTDASRRMRLQATGMELASEMVIKAVLGQMAIAEIPITLYRDGRNRRSHLRPWQDGWRHLRFMLLYSPTSLFLVPGALCMILGFVALSALAGGPRHIGVLSFDVHYMVLGSLLAILGYQLVTTGIFARAYTHAARLHTPDRLLATVARHFSIERGLAVGTALFLAGFAIDARILVGWLESGMGELDAVRPGIQASTLMILGAQTMFSSFFLGMLRLDRGDGTG